MYVKPDITRKFGKWFWRSPAALGYSELLSEVGHSGASGKQNLPVWKYFNLQKDYTAQ